MPHTKWRKRISDDDDYMQQAADMPLAIFVFEKRRPNKGKTLVQMIFQQSAQVFRLMLLLACGTRR